MRRLSLFLLIILVLGGALLLISCPRQVLGSVRDELSGESIADAVILTGHQLAHCDPQGRFCLGWVNGSVTLVVQADGYLPVQASVPRTRFPRVTVSLAVTLTPNSVLISVRDAETGRPLAGSMIVAGEVSAMADGQGQCTLRRVKTGTPLTTSAPAYQTGRAIFNGQEALDLSLQPAVVEVLVTDLYSGQPLSGAQVTWGTEQLSTDAGGVVILKRLIKGARLSVQATAHAAAEYVHDGGDKASIALRPNTLRGVISDHGTGKRVPGATVAAISSGRVITAAVTDAEGRYALLDLPHPITLVVAAAGYDRPELEVAPVTELDVRLEPLQVKGIYMPLGILTNEARVRELIDLVQRTELNAIVVDIKNDRGWLAFPSQAAEAQRSGAYSPMVMDVRKFIAWCREAGVYTVARLVLFKDETLIAAYPDWGVQTDEQLPWKDSSGAAWADPFRPEVQAYNVAIAKEVAALGFDELQFDYLRFPSDGSISKTRYLHESTGESRCAAIRDFCAQLRHELQPYGVLLSADLFGMTAWVTDDDMGIGQRVMDIAPYMDYISPMLYPATFTDAIIDYAEPVKHPYEIVYRSCVAVQKNTKTRVRPWLQHYSWGGVTYGEQELRLQKKAASDTATSGWIFWNSSGVYNEKAFDLVKKTE